jgi:predicted RNase H-like nuclease (RuvC/YqgF family)
MNNWVRTYRDELHYTRKRLTEMQFQDSDRTTDFVRISRVVEGLHAEVQRLQVLIDSKEKRIKELEWMLQKSLDKIG